ncbi:flagellin [Parvularcula lutaonensis]|uniref:Flagellin n=1 Tax=Parvularcula lutaonensis TaxID=491923 RepID=A0ABV7MA34_9PROT|nr:flagellin [Parvularcula lutaonensis]
MFTNLSAVTALKQLRTAQDVGDDVRAQISTGLKVRSADDNPAYFLVANTTRGDISVLKGLRDNLSVTEGAINAAQAGIRQLNELTLQLADMVPVAQNGVAIEQLNVTFNEIIEQAIDTIDAAGFQGRNLLADSGIETSVIGLNREGSQFRFQTLGVAGGDFKRKQFNNATVETANYFVLRANNFSGRADAGTATWSDSATAPGFMEWVDLPGPNIINRTPAEVLASSPRLDYRVQITNPGRYYINVRGMGYNGTSDSIHVGFNGTVLTGNGGVDLPTGGPGWGTRETGTGNRVFIDIPTPGLYTINIWGREDGARIEGIEFTDDPSIPSGATPLPPVTAIGGSDLPFFTDPVEGERRRAEAGFMELLKLVNPEAMRLAPESAMLVLDSARAKLNRYGAQLGAYEKQIDRQRSYLDGLTGDLEGAVADLVEADLAEASSRLQAAQVQEQLATQSLVSANSRSSLVLSLFR